MLSSQQHTAADLEAAVTLAFSPNTDPGTKARATAYCEEVRASDSGWNACVELFARTDQKTSLEVRFFTLGVLEDVVRTRWEYLPPHSRSAIRDTLWTWFASGLDANEPASVKNKAAQLLARLYRHLYLDSWPSFWTDLITLLASLDHSPAASDTFLRVCTAVDEEVVSRLVPRTPEEVRLNQLIKDTMRVRDVPRLVEAWLDILRRHASTSPEVAALCLRAAAPYAAWIDIRLVASPSFLQPLYGFIFSSSGPLCAPACDCLSEVVAKGMPPREKLDLLRQLRLPDLLSQVLPASRNTELGEHVARLVNTAGCELTSCWDEAGTRDNVVKDEAANAVEELVPFMVASLMDEYDETSGAVMLFLGEYLTLLKRQKRANGKLGLSQQNTLVRVAEAIVAKMKYDDEAIVGVGGGEDGDDDEADFAELRRNLKTSLDSVAAIDTTLYTTLVVSSVRTRLGALGAANGSAADVVSWTDAELAVYLLFQYADAVK
ncbi:pre-tRNA nuclear export protein, partial [Gonapodya sp. JEL0774]